MNKTTVILQKHIFDATRDLSAEDRGSLWAAVGDYAFRGIAPNFPPNTVIWMAWHMISASIDDDSERYQEIVAQRAVAGKKGNDTRWANKAKPDKPKAQEPEPEPPVPEKDPDEIVYDEKIYGTPYPSVRQYKGTNYTFEEWKVYVCEQIRLTRDADRAAAAAAAVD